jgi:hypothetical protein
MQQFFIHPQTCGVPFVGAPQYQGMWIQVLTLNGDPIMGSSSAPKMLGATITELKPKKCG